MLESDLTADEFRMRVRRKGGIVVQMIPTVAGVPDRLVLYRQQMYLVELKTDEGQVSDIQRVWHKKAYDLCGIEVIVLHGVDEVRDWAEAL